MEMKSDSMVGLIEAIKQSTFKASSNELYIPLHGKHTTNPEEEPFDLAEKIRSFFVFDDASQHDPKVMLLMGDTGSGKSVFSQQLHQQLCSAYKSGDPIPLWIPLPELQNPFEGAVEEVLTKYGFNDRQITETKAQEQFIFIVDGYDELHQFQNCYVTNKWEKWNAKILITCRSQALYYQQDPDKYFVPFNGEKRLPMLLRKLYVAAFSEEQISAYVKQYQQLIADHKIAEDDFTKVSGLAELIKTPFLLHLAVEALPDILMAQVYDQKMTQAKLYDIFIERWFMRQIKKLSSAGLLKDTEQTTKQQFWNYCKRLAQQMHEKQVSVIPYQAQKVGGRLFGKKEQTNSWESFFSEGTEVLRSACPLKRVGEHYYGFVHASMIEYFSTRAMYEEIQDDEFNSQNSVIVSKARQSSELVGFPGSFRVARDDEPYKNNQPRGGIHQRLFSHEKNAIRFLADRIELNETFKQKMLMILESSKKNKQFAIGAANAITALVKASVTFNSQNLSGIKISGADISGGYFDQADFTYADLRQSQMRNVWMREANLEGSHVEGVNFGEYPWVTIKQNKSLECLDYREDLQLCVTGSEKNLILWDTATAERCNKLHGHLDKVNCVQFSPNGKLIVSGSEDKTIRIWEVVTGAEIAVLIGHGYGVESVVFSPNGENVASGSHDKTVRIWNVAKAEQTHNLIGHEDGVMSVQFSPDGEHVVSGSRDHTIRIWAIGSGDMVTLMGHEAWVNCVKFSPDGKWLVSSDECGHNDTTRFWDVTSRKLIAALEGYASDIAFSPTGERVVTGKGNTVHVLDTVSQKVLFVLRGHEDGVKYVRFSQDGKRVISGSWDKTLRFWDVGGESYLARTREYEGRSDSVQFSQDGKLMALVSDDDTVRIWEVESGKERFVLRGHDCNEDTTQSSSDRKEVVSEGMNGIVLTTQFSPDGKWVVSGGRDGIVRLWEVESERLVREFQGHKSRVYGASFSPNGERVVSGGGVYRSRSGGDTSIRIWDVKSGKELMMLQGHEKIVRRVAFSHDGYRIFSRNDDTTGLDTTLSVWEVSSQKELVRWHCGSEDNVSSVSFSSHLDLAGYHIRGYVRIINLENGNTIFEMPVEENAIKVQFIWESNQIIMGCGQTIQIWDIATKRRIVAWEFPGQVKDFSYHRNGALTIGFYKDKSISCWQKTSEQNNDHLELRWSTDIDSPNLVIKGLKASCVIGLSDQNRRMLEQRGAILSTELNEILSSKLVNAVKVEDLTLVNSLLMGGANVHATDNEGLTALHWCALTGHEMIAKKLIGHGALINAKTFQNMAIERVRGMTPLHFAVTLGHTNITKLLLAYGAEIDLHSNDGRTPLHVAASAGYGELFEILLKGGADINAIDNNGWTVLHWAISSDHQELLSMMVIQGAAVNAKAHNGMTPLHKAANKGDKKALKILLEHGAEINAKATDSGYTSLHYTAQLGDLEIIKLLLAENASINAKENDNETPLHCAAQHGHAAVVEVMLSDGADITAKRNDGATVLHLAVWNNHLEVIRMLLSHGMEINVRSNSGRTPLHWAAQKTELNEIVEFLLTQHADMAVKDNNGWAPLHSATSKGCIKNVETLLDNGAYIEAKDNDGGTPLHAAVWGNHYETVEILLTYKAAVDALDNEGCTPLHCAAQIGNKDIIALLLKHGADIKALDSSRGTMLHHAAVGGQSEFACTILVYGNIESINISGRRPLHLAAREGHEKVVGLLLGNKAKINVQDTEFGNTPLHFAAQNGHGPVVKILVEHGADPEIINTAGVTALQIAKQQGHQSEFHVLDEWVQSRKALRRNSSDAAAYFSLGISKVFLNHYSEAIRDFVAALEYVDLTSDSSSAFLIYSFKAFTLFLQDLYDESEQSLRQAYVIVADLENKCDLIYTRAINICNLVRGLLQYALGNTADTNIMFESLTKSTLNNPIELRSELSTMQGMGFAHMQCNQRAFECWAEVLEINPNFESALRQKENLKESLAKTSSADIVTTVAKRTGSPLYTSPREDNNDSAKSFTAEKDMSFDN